MKFDPGIQQHQWLDAMPSSFLINFGTMAVLLVVALLALRWMMRHGRRH